MCCSFTEIWLWRRAVTVGCHGRVVCSVVFKYLLKLRNEDNEGIPDTYSSGQLAPLKHPMQQGLTRWVRNSKRGSEVQITVL